MVACGGSPEKSGQKTFPAPEDAIVALVDSARAGNKAELSAIFGPEGGAILSSGDPVMDRYAVQTFVLAYDQRAQLSEENGKQVLLIGNEDAEIAEGAGAGCFRWRCVHRRWRHSF